MWVTKRGLIDKYDKQKKKRQITWDNIITAMHWKALKLIIA
jgi:hypothetical protein